MIPLIKHDGCSILLSRPASVGDLYCLINKDRKPTLLYRRIPTFLITTTTLQVTRTHLRLPNDQQNFDMCSGKRLSNFSSGSVDNHSSDLAACDLPLWAGC